MPNGWIKLPVEGLERFYLRFCPRYGLPKMKKICTAFAVLLLALTANAQQNAPRLIVRGDDMGFSHSGNEALIKTYRNGIVTSIEVLVPSPWFPEAHMNCTNLSEEVQALTRKLAREYKIDIDLQKYPVVWVNYEGPTKTAAEKIASFPSMLEHLESGKTYLFLDHPGLDDAELQAIHHIGYEQVAADRQGVTDLFTSAEVKAFIRKKGIQLIGYRDLVADKK